jgi:seryl-tRNA synthetase
MNRNEQVHVYTTNEKVMIASESDAVYTNIWLQFTRVARMSATAQCRMQVHITAIRDAALRFMLDDNEQSYQFGLVQTPSLVPE